MSGLIDHRAVEYNRVEEDVNNQVLVTNILRARDNAPLYLAEFQDIHVTMTSSLTETGIAQFGGGKLNGKALSANSALQIQSQPSFDAIQLDTQQFTLGMLAPISPTAWEYYWHRSYSPELLLRLFLGTITDGRSNYYNRPCATTDASSDCKSYLKFSDRVDSLADDKVFLNIFSTLTPAEADASPKPAAGSSIRTVLIDGEKRVFEESPPSVEICTVPKGLSPADVEALWDDVAKYEVKPCVSGAAQSSSSGTRSATPPTSALGSTPEASGSLSSDEMALFMCTHRKVVICKQSWSSLQLSTVEGHGYVLRSVDAILHYLGEVQRIVDADAGPDDAPKGVIWKDNGVTNTLFELHSRPSARDRITVAYRGRPYYVRQGDPTDHTLEVIALVNQLINANKVANEIPSTKAVQIVP
jgi:hypothetical protein